MKIDYLVVGQGVAGSCFSLKLLKEKKSFFIIDKNKFKASSVAVGMYNPVVLKRFSLIWEAEIQMTFMYDYFKEFERLLSVKILHELPTHRIFKNSEEIKTWKKKSIQPDLVKYLNPIVQKEDVKNFDIPFGFSEVYQTGRIDLKLCLETFYDYLEQNNHIRNEDFDFSQLEFLENKIKYKEIEAKRIVFCEGFGIKSNPFLNYLPIIGVKGEVLKIKTEQKIPQAIWKAHNFLLPIGENRCFTASTYDREDVTFQPTEKGKLEMLGHLEEFYNGKYEIVEQMAGIRPTVVDRRPILGSHRDHPNLFVLNGMGTRGTLLAPKMSEDLFSHIEYGEKLSKESTIRRFDNLLNKS